MVGPEVVRRAVLVAVAGVAFLVVMMVASRTPAERAIDAAAFYAFPSRLRLDIQPGHARVAVGSSLRITAHVRGADRVMTPVVELVPIASGAAGSGDQPSSARVMVAAGRKDEFVITVDDVRESFKYRVSAGPVNSSTFDVSVLRPPHVRQIDLSYEYPPSSGLQNRVDEDSGDIYAPMGTTVRLRVQTDKPVTNGEMVMADGSRQRHLRSATWWRPRSHRRTAHTGSRSPMRKDCGIPAIPNILSGRLPIDPLTSASTNPRAIWK